MDTTWNKKVPWWMRRSKGDHGSKHSRGRKPKKYAARHRRMKQYRAKIARRVTRGRGKPKKIRRGRLRVRRRGR